MTRIFLLSDGKNPHTIKWARSLAEKQFDIVIFSLNSFNFEIYEQYPNIRCFHAGFEENSSLKGFQKLKYLKTIFLLKKLIKEFKPDYLHAHYASSYGFLGALTCFSPYYISVWGTDVFEFPKNGFAQKLVFKFNMWMATKIFSTSHVMAKEVSLYTNKNIFVIPFGVNIDSFRPEEKKLHLFPENSVVVGTVKTLDTKYGIQVLIRAFSEVKHKFKDFQLKLLIVGKGPLDQEFKTLADQVGVAEDTIFTGFIPVEKVPLYHNLIDISVFPSICSESFGVAVIEASACEKPVIVTRKGGLPEVVEENVTGLIIPANDVDALADSINLLLYNPDLRKKMGIAGRSRVTKLYDWKSNLNEMISHYQK